MQDILHNLVSFRNTECRSWELIRLHHSRVDVFSSDLLPVLFVPVCPSVWYRPLSHRLTISVSRLAQKSRVSIFGQALMSRTNLFLLQGPQGVVSRI